MKNIKLMNKLKDEKGFYIRKNNFPSYYNLQFFSSFKLI